MPTLKRADQLLWGDLEYIESPDMICVTQNTTDVHFRAVYSK